MKNAKNKAILIAFITLAWPTVLEQLLGTVLQYVDTAMVGWLGPEATATVSLSSTYGWLLGSVMSAMGIGFLSYIARAIGEQNEYKIRTGGGQAVLAVFGLGGLLTLCALSAAPFMPAWMGADPAIRRDASWYFAIINTPLILRAAMVIFGAVIRSTGDTRTPMKINVFMNLCNVVLNYIFIYILAMGAIGAGIATALSYATGGILMTVVFMRNRVILFQMRYAKPDKRVLIPIMRISFPVMMTHMVSCLGYIVFTSFVSSMTTVIYAAHSIAITAEQLFYIPGYGMQAATSTLIGNAIGEQDREKEMAVMRYSMGIIFGMMCLSGLALYLWATQMMSIFTHDAEVIAIGARLLRIVAMTEPIFGTCAVMEGIYAAMGETTVIFVTESVTRWGIRIGGSWLLLNLFAGDIYQVWYAMIADNITKALILFVGLLVLTGKRGRGYNSAKTS